MDLSKIVFDDTIECVANNVAILFQESQKRYGIKDFGSFAFGIICLNLNHYLINNEIDANDLSTRFDFFSTNKFKCKNGKIFELNDFSNDELTFASYIAVYCLIFSCSFDFPTVKEEHIVEYLFNKYWLIKGFVSNIFNKQYNDKAREYLKLIEPIIEKVNVNEFINN